MEVGLDEMYEISVQWIKEAGELIKLKMNESYEINTKSNVNDLVTDIDMTVELYFMEKLMEEFPTHRLMGEEGSYEKIKDLSGTVWILDPIDGTMNFVHQRQFFAISLGIFVEGIGVIGIVYDVMKNELFSAQRGKGAYLNGSKLPVLLKGSPFQESIIAVNPGWIVKRGEMQELVREVRGVRSYGSAALEIAYVAANRLDAYISYHLAPWDVAGGCIILTEVGGVATNNGGEKLTYMKTDSFVAAKPKIHEKILKKYF